MAGGQEDVARQVHAGVHAVAPVADQRVAVAGGEEAVEGLDHPRYDKSIAWRVKSNFLLALSVRSFYNLLSIKLGFAQLNLLLPEYCIATIAFQQLIMASSFDDSALFHNANQIRIHDCTQAVGYH